MASLAGGIGEIVVGVVVAVLLAAAFVWLARKGYFEPDTNEQGIEEAEQLSESIGQQDFRIPYRRRVASWSLPYKVFVGSLTLLLLGFGVATYQMLKTGSPFQQFLTREIQIAAVAVVSVGIGVRLKDWFDDQIGELIVIYERSGAEDLIERIPYAKGRVRRRDGSITVPEVVDNRLLGLFWRYRQVGEDRRLRGTNKPMDDVTMHLVSDHAKEIPDGDGFVLTTRDDGDQILPDATSPADIAYSSPHSMSRERAIETREKLSRKDAEVRAVRATNAEQAQQLRKLRKKIENEEYLDREDLLEDIREIMEMTNNRNVIVSDQAGGNGSGSGADSEEASS